MAKFLCDGETLKKVFAEMKKSSGALVSDYMPKCRNLSPSGRTCFLVTGENLGGYVGLSLGEDGFHIGTPSFAESRPLIEACEKLDLKKL